LFALRLVVAISFWIYAITGKQDRHGTPLKPVYRILSGFLGLLMLVGAYFAVR
jgi:hypothetical protein